MKKKIFIGSSSEALPIVDEVEKLLEKDYNILRWDKSFTPNQSTLDCLIENAIKVDKAIFIGTSDDIVEDLEGKRGQKIKHRDNVVFEFGLFLGMLGRADCIYLVEKGSDMMSDYSGITVIMFDKGTLNVSIPKAVDAVIDHFEKYSNRDINLFPSASLASAYFVNFIQPIFTHYLNNKHKIITDKRQYGDCEITIILPSTISNDVNKQSEELKQKVQTRIESIEYLGRDRKIVVDVTSTNKKLKIFDFPTVTAGIYHAVRALLPNEQIKQQPDYDTIFKRELRRFAETLELYIKEDACNSIKVSILEEDNLIINIPAKKGLVKQFLNIFRKK